MALYGCPDCGEPISSESMVCPKCGWHQKKPGCGKGCLIAVAITLGLLGFAIFSGSRPSNNAGTTTSSDALSKPDGPPAEPATVPAPETSEAAVPLNVFIKFPERFSGQSITASTNLPDETVMMGSLQPVAPCSPNCGYAWEGDIVVHHGHLVIGPFNTVSPGVYSLVISTPMTDLQPASVRAVFGAGGQNLRGDFVKPFSVGTATEYLIEYTGTVTLPASDP